MNRRYRIGEFAELAGVTVRALHHYDRVGLLKPQRSPSGNRLYSMDDLHRLEQIAALKFLGISLSEIKYLLSAKTLTLLESFDFQLVALKEKRQQIDRAILAIEVATREIRSGQPTDESVLTKILEIIDMQPQENSMRKYYAEQAWLARTELIQNTPAEVYEERNRSWRQLFNEIEAAPDLDPASEAAQTLTKRWLLLADASTGGNEGIRNGYINAWKDHSNWPASQQGVMLAAFGLDLIDRTASMQRLERVVHFIGEAVSQKARAYVRRAYGLNQPQT